MSAMSKIIGKVKSKCAVGTSVKEERKPVKDVLMGLKSLMGYNYTKKHYKKKLGEDIFYFFPEY